MDMFGFAVAVVAFVPTVAVAAGVAVPAVGGIVGGCRGRWLGTVGGRIGVVDVAGFVLLLRRQGFTVGTWGWLVAVFVRLRR